MSRHTQGSLAIVGAIAPGIFLVAFVALMVLGGYDVSPAAFLAILVSAIAALVLYWGFGGSPSAPVSMSKPAPVAQKPAPVAKEMAEPAPAPAPAAPATAAPAAAAPASSEETEGTRPVALDAPRGGKGDDLKQIKGVGPKLEQLCNSLGFWHFDQIASWSADEVAWVDANLAGFKGRVSRDDWVAQAKVLAAGGETEFSKRVEDGGVY